MSRHECGEDPHRQGAVPDRRYPRVGPAGPDCVETDQDGTTTRFEYTTDGLVASVTTGYGQVTTNTYHPTTRELVRDGHYVPDWRAVAHGIPV